MNLLLQLVLVASSRVVMEYVQAFVVLEYCLTILLSLVHGCGDHSLLVVALCWLGDWSFCQLAVDYEILVLDNLS